MLKEIRKTVRASMKLQSESNVFAQFLEEVGYGFVPGLSPTTMKYKPDVKNISLDFQLDMKNNKCWLDTVWNRGHAVPLT